MTNAERSLADALKHLEAARSALSIAALSLALAGANNNLKQEALDLAKDTRSLIAQF